MPTYDYRCDGCNHQFEELQSFSDPVLTTCPSCGQESLRRLFGTGAAVLFKGSGFYETDYRSDSYKSAAKQESDSASPKADSKGDSSGAAKSDSGKASGGSSSSTTDS